MATKYLVICDSCKLEGSTSRGWFSVFRQADDEEMALEWDFCSDACLMQFAAEIILADELGNL
jgi:hypothetical protein